MRDASIGKNLHVASDSLNEIRDESKASLNKSGAACETAVKAGKAPAAYGDFVLQFRQSLDIAAGTFKAAEEASGIDASQMALLDITATSLQSADAMLGVPVVQQPQPQTTSA